MSNLFKVFITQISQIDDGDARLHCTTSQHYIFAATTLFLVQCKEFLWSSPALVYFRSPYFQRG